MKKGISILVLLAVVTAGAFAQNVSLDMQVSRYGSGNDIFTGMMMEELGVSLSMPNTIPGIGVAIDIGTVEFLAEIEFWRTGLNISDDDIGVDLSGSLNHFSISGGIAPIVRATDSLALTFPIMLTFSRLSAGMEADDLDLEVRIATNSFRINLGTKLFYSLTPRWSVFAGVQVAAFTRFGKPTLSLEAFGDSESVDIPITSTAFFNNGRVDLGVRRRF